MQSGRYDLVLMDVRMPVMDGLEATRRIRKQLGWYGPVVGLTANSSREELQSCEAAGMDAIIVKPFDPHRLLSVIGHWLPPAPPAEKAPEAGLLRTFMARDKLAEMVRQHVPSLLLKADVLAAEGDPVARADTAHALASPLGFLGLMELQRRCLALEADWRAGRPVAAGLGPVLARDIRAGLEAIQEELNAQPG
jgi:CheY-like chemotaxis protein